MLIVLHNNRCSKSREAVQFLEEKGAEFEIRYYLENPLDKEEIQHLLKQLGLSAEDIIRKNEAIWKEQFSEKTYSEEELILILEKHPKLLQRPIVIKGEKAVVARPTENIEQLF